MRRAIFDASKLKHQLDFIKTLRDDKVELILDTKAAELARAKGGHRLIVGQDPNCCRSLSDMTKHSRRHSVIQESKALDALNRAPDLMRTQHFLEKEPAEADRFARQVKDLKPVAAELRPRTGQTQEQAAESLSLRLAKQALRNEKMRSSLENLYSIRGLGLRRAPAVHLSERVRAGGRL